MALSTASLDPTFVAAFRAGTLTAEQANAALPMDRVAIVFLLLQLSALSAGVALPNAHTPSATVPPYAKPTTPPRTTPKDGQPGHPGRSRPKPTRIDRHEEHTLTHCPDCGNPFNRPS